MIITQQEFDAVLSRLTQVEREVAALKSACDDPQYVMNESLQGSPKSPHVLVHRKYLTQVTEERLEARKAVAVLQKQLAEEREKAYRAGYEKGYGRGADMSDTDRVDDDWRTYAAGVHAGAEMVSTSELTPHEIVFARQADMLTVREDAMGFVPRKWIEDFRRRTR